ncbi:MAG: CinA family nicotinamide mononucleotide deamidase-related protein [Pseudomonadota bacterium]
MIVEVLTLGDELLDGRRIDTNMAWLGRRFTALGVPPRYRQSTTDRMEEIVAAFQLALTRSDVVISTGGLGPTADDITFEAAARALGRDLEFRPEIWTKLEERLSKRGFRILDSQKRQANLPKGAMEIPNEYGTAPGCLIEEKGKLVACLPGPPREMIPLFEKGVLPEIEKRLGTSGRRLERSYHLLGLPESYVEEAVDRCALPKISGGEIRIAYTESFPQIDVTLSVVAKPGGSALRLLGKADTAVRKELGEYLVSLDAETIEGRVVREFAEIGLHLAVAESMTGGILAGKIVDVPGSSSVFERGFVTYSDRSKIELLGVSEETLARHGAVSEECAAEMVAGAKSRAGTEVAVATTGIAGPTGATEKKPVGLTYVAWAGPAGTEVARYQFRWDRNRNRMMAVFESLRGLLRLAERLRLSKDVKEKSWT